MMRDMLPDFLPPRDVTGFIHEPARRTPVIARCDVAVLGGGPAGVCAAAAAARMGKRVVLVEHYGFLGGVATAANVTIWHSLYGTDRQTRIIGGIPEEIIRNLASQRAIYNQAKDGETGPWVVCTETTKLVLDDLVVHSGVKLLLHTKLVDVIHQDGRAVAALVESKSGRHAIEADVFIDCTGDADLVRRAGVATQLGGEQGQCQPPSLCFRVGNVDAEKIKNVDAQAELFKQPMDYNGQPYPCFFWSSVGVFDKTERMLSAVRIPHVNAADTWDLTRAEVHGRYQLRWVLAQLMNLEGWRDIHLRDIATQIGVRESHRILADHQLTRDEVNTGHAFEDTIAQGTYPIDIHTPDGPGIAFEYLNGKTYEILSNQERRMGRWDGQPEDAPLRDTLCWRAPFRSLIPRGLTNVLAAGRCIGADHRAAGAIRVMINAMQFGQAAGTAAAMARDGVVRSVQADALRAQLMAQDVPLLK